MVMGAWQHGGWGWKGGVWFTGSICICIVVLAHDLGLLVLVLVYVLSTQSIVDHCFEMRIWFAAGQRTARLSCRVLLHGVSPRERHGHIQ
jgi:hypothetical protein